MMTFPEVEQQMADNERAHLRMPWIGGIYERVLRGRLHVVVVLAWTSLDPKTCMIAHAKIGKSLDRTDHAHVTTYRQFMHNYRRNRTLEDIRDGRST